MYTSYKLENNPSFKMLGKDFNTLVNSITSEQTGDSKPVRLGLTIRTATSNEVAMKDNQIIHTFDIDPELGAGYFNLLNNIKILLTDTFGDLPFSLMQQTVLMPVGAFENEGIIYIYFVLVIQDSHVETFSTNDQIRFVHIEGNALNNLDKKSIIILPTLTVVKNK